MLRKRTTTMLLCVFTAVIGFSAGCSSGNPEEQKVAPAQPSPGVTPAASNKTTTVFEASPAAQLEINPAAQLEINSTPAKYPKPPPPKPEEVRDAVARVFEKTAAPDVDHPTFVAGDFNGDGSEDLAVVLKPNEGMLAEINNELANWTIEDPRKIIIPKADDPVRRRAGKPAPVRADKGDTLLAIIHGVGAQGWRSSEARQTYLLKNGAGTNMMAESAESLLTSKEKQKLVRVRGDAIRQKIGGKSGLVLWSGSRYAWYTGAP